MTEWFEGLSTDEARMERCYWRRVGLVITLAGLAAVLLAPLVACSSAPPVPERFLTAEQDAEMRNVCEPAGCQIVPTPAWVQIEAILRRMGAI